jgi:hypothetical protein
MSVTSICGFVQLNMKKTKNKSTDMNLIEFNWKKDLVFLKHIAVVGSLRYLGYAPVL